MRVHLLALLLLAPACGGTAVEDDVPDAGSPDAPRALAHVNVIGSNLDVIAYRDGDGDWQAPRTSADGWTLDVTDDFTLVTVCHASATMFLRRAGDGDIDVGSCSTTASLRKQATAADTVTMRGTMKQPGQVYGFPHLYWESDTAPWDFEIAGPPGPRDLIARDAHRILIRRAIDVSADVTVPDVDLDQDGVAIGSQPLTLDGLEADDNLQILLGWSTQYGWLSFEATATELFQPPASIVVPDDSMDIFASIGGLDSHGAYASRQTDLHYDGGPLTIALAPRIDAVMHVTELGPDVELHTIPVSDELDLDAVVQVGTVLHHEHIVASGAWLALRHPTTLTFDRSAPGFAANAIDYATHPEVDLYLDSYSATTHWSLSLQQQFNLPPAMSRRPPRAP